MTGVVGIGEISDIDPGARLPDGSPLELGNVTCGNYNSAARGPQILLNFELLTRWRWISAVS